jgi:hypothetical protein
MSWGSSTPLRPLYGGEHQGACRSAVRYSVLMDGTWQHFSQPGHIEVGAAPRTHPTPEIDVIGLHAGTHQHSLPPVAPTAGPQWV